MRNIPSSSVMNVQIPTSLQYMLYITIEPSFSRSIISHRQSHLLIQILMPAPPLHPDLMNIPAMSRMFATVVVVCLHLTVRSYALKYYDAASKLPSNSSSGPHFGLVSSVFSFLPYLVVFVMSDCVCFVRR